jgi:cytochrome c oxidase cbb3-type subunit 3
MGPDLTDRFWRYGGTPVQIYKSIYEGRPKGMPAWGRALPARSLWELTAYVQSLGGSFPAQDYHAGLQGDAQATPGRLAQKTGTSGLPEGQ